MIEQATEKPTAVDAAMSALALELDPSEQEQLVADMAMDQATSDAEALAYRDGPDPDAWQPAYVASQSKAIDDAKANIDAFAARQKKRLELKRKYIIWKWGPSLQAFCNRNRGKQQSIDSGIMNDKGKPVRIGWRKRPTTPRLVIDDEDQAVSHAADECPKAVKVKRSLLKSELPEGFVPRGCHMEIPPEGNTFFIGKYTVNPPKDETPVLGHQGRVDADKFLASDEVPDFGEQT